MTDKQRRRLHDALKRFETLPDENPGDTFRGADHDRVLYGETLHYTTEEQILRAWILFRQRVAAGWSFTDCTSKVAIDELGITRAVALDDHFRQFGIAIVP